LADLGRLEEALASYERALALNPRYAVAWNNKGNTLRHLRRYPEAQAALDRAIELDPESGLGWLTKAQTLRDMRAYADAISAYERAIALRHQPARANANLGLVFDALAEYRLCFIQTGMSQAA